MAQVGTTQPTRSRPARHLLSGWVADVYRWLPSFVSTALGGEDMVARHPRNERGRDLVVGDIHGMFHSLSEMLRQLDFDAGRDRLFAVGDLIDRGPHSERAGEFLQEPWFHSIRGNHDQLLLDAATHGWAATGLWCLNGGMWHRRLPDRRAIVQQLREQFSALPLAAEIETDTGTVGLLHAEVPSDRTWPELLAALVAGDRMDAAAALWNIDHAKRALHIQWHGETDGAPRPQPVQGIGRLIHGHVRVRSALPAANTLLIDTGAELDIPPFGKLTMIQLGPGPWQRYEFNTQDSNAKIQNLPLPDWPDVAPHG